MKAAQGIGATQGEKLQQYVAERYKLSPEELDAVFAVNDSDKVVHTGGAGEKNPEACTRPVITSAASIDRNVDTTNSTIKDEKRQSSRPYYKSGPIADAARSLPSIAVPRFSATFVHPGSF